MPRTTKNTEMQLENERLRLLLEQQSQANQAMANRLAAMGATIQRPSTDIMVGVRNICDDTVGERSPFPNEPDLHLHADFGLPDPNTVGVVSFAWWQRMRKGRLIGEGRIMRDDSVLGGTYQAAPPDRPEDIDPGFYVNAIPQPELWIESKTEQELREAIDRITALSALRRLRGVVDRKLLQIEKQFTLDDPNRMKKALKALPALYRFVDEMITTRLEQPDDDED